MLWSKRNEIAQLIRWDRPYGTLLLLFPTLWSLFVASSGRPAVWHLVVFILGSFFMRSAGCVINDMADYRVDAQVARTKNRPLAKGALTHKEALWVLLFLLTLSFLLVLTLNRQTILLSFIALFMAGLYPFTKRFTYFPQVILGVAFSFGILMAWTATQGELTGVPVLIWVANLFWTAGYDTIYALMDKEDDQAIGIKSTALFFGAKSGLAIGLSFSLAFVFLVLAGWMAERGIAYYMVLAIAMIIFLYQTALLCKSLEQKKLFALFKAHVAVGGIILAGIIMDFY